MIQSRFAIPSVNCENDSYLHITLYNRYQSTAPTLTCQYEELVVTSGGGERYVEGQHSFVAGSSSGTATPFSFPLTKGVLTSLKLYISSATVLVRGNLYAVAEITKGNTTNALTTAVLFSDYITPSKALVFPNGGGGTAVDSISGVGAPIVAQSGPLAGLATSITTPANVFWKLTGLRATMATDATAGTRYPYIQIAQNLGMIFSIPAGFGLAPSSSRNDYYQPWNVPASNNVINSLGVGVYPLPAGIILNAGSGVQFSCENTVAGDTLTAYVYAEEFISL
jgi:hypothetical protein